MATFTASTIVRDNTGRSHVFTEGQTVPEWAVGLISSDILTEAGVPVEVTESEPETGTDEAAKVSIPPKAGKGSSATAWAAYAKSQGFEVEDDAKASEIREALAEAGVPVE